MILNEVVETAWIDYNDDESYLLKYVSVYEFGQFQDKDVDKFIDKIVLDWKGVNKKENGEIVKLECNLENKLLLLDFSPKRWQFILRSSRNPVNFFDIDENLKNSKGL